MKKHSSWFGVVGLAAGVVAAIAFVVPQSPAVASAAESPALFAGQLTKSYDAMSASELSALGEHLAFTGGAERARMCSGTPACDAGVARTSVQIEAVDQAPIGSSNIPVDGVIIVRLKNTGEFTERRYGLAPGALGYLIALPSGGGTTVGRGMLVEIAGGAKKVLATGTIASCKHATYSGKPEADFRSCAAAGLVHAQGATISPASVRTGDNDPMWIMCDQGCCVLAQ